MLPGLFRHLARAEPDLAGLLERSPQEAACSDVSGMRVACTQHRRRWLSREAKPESLGAPALIVSCLIRYWLVRGQYGGRG